MKQELNIEENENQKRVIKKLHPTDWLFIILPMVLIVILTVIVPIVLLISEKARGNRTDLFGFDIIGLVIIAGILFSAFFCGGYFFLAFILSLLTRRNITFRILLTSIPLLAAITFFGYVFYFPAQSDIPSEYPANENSEYWEKSALRFVKENHTTLKHEKKA